MDLQEFSALNKFEQSKLVGSARWVASKQSGNTMTVLYKLDQFYFEGYYSLPERRLFKLHENPDSVTITSYYVNANINPLTREAYKSVFAPAYDQRYVQ